MKNLNRFSDFYLLTVINSVFTWWKFISNYKIKLNWFERFPFKTKSRFITYWISKNFWVCTKSSCWANHSIHLISLRVSSSYSHRLRLVYSIHLIWLRVSSGGFEIVDAVKAKPMNILKWFSEYFLDYCFEKSHLKQRSGREGKSLEVIIFIMLKFINITATKHAGETGTKMLVSLFSISKFHHRSEYSVSSTIGMLIIFGKVFKTMLK